MIKVEVKGLKDTLAKFKKLGDKAVTVVEQVTGQTANEMTAVAKRSAPVDLGKLRQNIANTQETKLSYKIEAFEVYAPYVEFGTGGLVDVQPGWEDMAIQFKGKGIKQVNLPARPFMFPAYLHGKKIYKQDLEDSLNALIKQNE